MIPYGSLEYLPENFIADISLQPQEQLEGEVVWSPLVSIFSLVIGTFVGVWVLSQVTDTEMVQ